MTDIHEYLAEFDDIPGTRVYTAKRARQGYHLNQFAMSLMKDENRKRFHADENAYLDEWPITDEQKQDTVTHEAHAYRDALAVDFTDRAKVLRARHRAT